MKVKFRSAWPERRRQFGFWALIELLVVAVIIVVALSFYLKGTREVAETNRVMQNPDAVGADARTVPGAAMQQAQGVTCKNNLQNLRLAVAAYQTQNEGYPPDLQSLQAQVPLTCPVGGEPYQYDPNTGQVHCVHHGHESY